MTRQPDFSPAKVAPEPCWSIEEVAAFFGCKRWTVDRLCFYGRKYRSKLHPTKGGLWPTYRPIKSRRIPLSAINRHLRHQARVHSDPEPPAVVLIPRADAGALQAAPCPPAA